MTDQPFQRPSLREAARRGAPPNQPATPAQPDAAAADASPARPAPAKPKPPVVGVEQVIVRCGHSVPFELFEPKKDKFREGRREKLTSRDCAECRKKAHDERTAAEMAAARERRQGQPAKPRREAAGRGPHSKESQDRLPHGSRFDGLLWDAEKGEWSGTLTVPDPAAEGGVRTFAARASGVFQLLRKLDGMYRDSLAEAPQTASEHAPQRKESSP